MRPPSQSERVAPAGRGRVRIGHVAIDRLGFKEAVDAVEDLVSKGEGGVVFTPNVDHIVLADEDADFRAAYGAADLSLVDGAALLWAARALGVPLPEKVSGSDLVRPLIARAADRGWRVYLLGAAPGVADRAKEILEREHPGLQVVGTSSPNINLGMSREAEDAVLEPLCRVRPHLVFLALGAPKQEVWAHRIRDRVRPAVLLCVGASLDFVAGTAKRAPRWVSEAGFEWLYRLLHEPRRLWRRYLVRDPKFLVILLREATARRR